MLVGYDDVNLALVPRNPQVVFAYEDGLFRNLDFARRAFPRAHVFTIAVHANHDADFLDIEKSDATVDQLAEWWTRQRNRGTWRPGAYASIDNGMPDIQRVMEKLAPREQYRLWSADYTHSPHINGGMDGTQWTDRALGRSLDESLLLPTFVPAPAKPKPQHIAAEVEFDLETHQWRVTPLPENAPPLR